MRLQMRHQGRSQTIILEFLVGDATRLTVATVGRSGRTGNLILSCCCCCSSTGFERNCHQRPARSKEHRACRRGDAVRPLLKTKRATGAGSLLVFKPEVKHACLSVEIYVPSVHSSTGFYPSYAACRWKSSMSHAMAAAGKSGAQEQLQWSMRFTAAAVAPQEQRD